MPKSLGFALVAAFVVIATASWWVGRTTSGDHETIVPSEDRDLVAAVNGLKEEIIGLHQAIVKQSSAVAGVQRVPTNQIGTDAGDAAHLLTDIKAALSEILRANGRTEGVRFHSSAAVQPVEKNSAAITEAATNGLAHKGANTRRHFCWTALDVYSTYGAPDSVETYANINTTTWQYFGENERVVMQFSFSDGLVIRVAP
jgi:hypothetical protein